MASLSSGVLTMSHAVHHQSDGLFHTLLQCIVTRWRGLPLLCNYCCYPIDPASVSQDEQVGWCPECRRSFQASLFRIPGWVAGVIMVLVIKAQTGC